MLEGDSESISQGTKGASRQLASRSGVGPGILEKAIRKKATIGQSEEEIDADMKKNWWCARDRRMDGTSMGEEKRVMELLTREVLMKDGSDSEAWKAPIMKKRRLLGGPKPGEIEEETESFSSADNPLYRHG